MERTSLFGDQAVISRDRNWIISRGLLYSVPPHAALWLLLYYCCQLGTDAVDATSMADRLGFTARWLGVLVFMTLGVVMTAIGCERGVTVAMNPLTLPFERYSLPMRVKVRVQNHTVEHFLIFGFGLLGLASYCDDAASLRAVPASAVVWFVARMVYWIGYRYDARYRAFGFAAHMVLQNIILCYVGYRLGVDVTGSPAGGVVVPVLYLGGWIAMQIYWLRVAARHASAPPSGS